MASATIFEAKTNFSDLIQRAQAGEPIIITSGREKTPVAELKAVVPVRHQRLGACYNPKFELPADFNDPMPDAEFDQREAI